MNDLKGRRFAVRHDSPLLEYLFELFPDQSRKGVKACLSNGRTLVNGVSVTAFDHPLRTGDELFILAKGVSIVRSERENAQETARELGVEIVYEDAHCLVVNKASGLPTIATRGARADGSAKREKTVYSILTAYMKGKARSERVNLGRRGKLATRVFIIHRIDRGTSGLLLFAKDEETKNLLQSRWNDLVRERKYVGIVEGVPARTSGVVESWLRENPKSLVVESLPADDGSGNCRHAVTRFKVLEPWIRPDNASSADPRIAYSKIEFELETGRKNQVRVHCKALGCPIAGDKKYGASTNPIGRLALHAKTLSFRDPVSGKLLTFDSPIPKGF